MIPPGKTAERDPALAQQALLRVLRKGLTAACEQLCFFVVAEAMESAEEEDWAIR